MNALDDLMLELVPVPVDDRLDLPERGNQLHELLGVEQALVVVVESVVHREDRGDRRRPVQKPPQPGPLLEAQQPADHAAAELRVEDHETHRRVLDDDDRLGRSDVAVRLRGRGSLRRKGRQEVLALVVVAECEAHRELRGQRLDQACGLCVVLGQAVPPGHVAEDHRRFGCGFRGLYGLEDLLHGRAQVLDRVVRRTPLGGVRRHVGVGQQRPAHGCRLTPRHGEPRNQAGGLGRVFDGERVRGWC